MLVNEWKSIETAPKTGTEILVIDRYGFYQLVYWRDNCEFGGFVEGEGWQVNSCEDSYYSYGLRDSDILYWMPLPKGPNSDE